MMRSSDGVKGIRQGTWVLASALVNERQSERIVDAE